MHLHREARPAVLVALDVHVVVVAKVGLHAGEGARVEVVGPTKSLPATSIEPLLCTVPLDRSTSTMVCPTPLEEPSSRPFWERKPVTS